MKTRLTMIIFAFSCALLIISKPEFMQFTVAHYMVSSIMGGLGIILLFERNEQVNRFVQQFNNDILLAPNPQAYIESLRQPISTQIKQFFVGEVNHHGIAIQIAKSRNLIA